MHAVMGSKVPGPMTTVILISTSFLNKWLLCRTLRERNSATVTLQCINILFNINCYK